MSKKTAIAFAIATMTVVSSGLLAGCSSDGGKPQSIASEARVNEIVQMRDIYDKVGGKWESLSEEDKATYTRLAGGEAKAKELWTNMGNPMGSNPSGG